MKQPSYLTYLKHSLVHLFKTGKWISPAKVKHFTSPVIQRSMDRLLVLTEFFPKPLIGPKLYNDLKHTRMMQDPPDFGDIAVWDALRKHGLIDEELDAAECATRGAVLNHVYERLTEHRS